MKEGAIRVSGRQHAGGPRGRHEASPSRGIALLEVMIAAMLVAIAVTAIAQATVNSMLATRQVDERLAASLAARKKMEEIANTPFDQIVDRYRYGGTIGNTFDVYMTEAGSGSQTLLQGLSDPYGIPQKAAEIIIITNEDSTAADYGRDLKPYDGRPDSCEFVGLPMDLNGNGTLGDGNVWGSLPNQRTAVRFPVGIVVRWPGVKGDERYELWNVISKY